MSVDDKRRTEQLRGKLNELSTVSDEVENGLRTALQQSIQSRDLEGKLAGFLGTVHRDTQVPIEAWDILDSAISARLEAARVLRAQLAESVPFFTGSAQAVLTSTSTATGPVSWAWPAELERRLQSQYVVPSPGAALARTAWSPEQVKAFHELIGGVKNAFAYIDSLPEVIALMVKLRADGAHPGKRNAADHFMAARSAYEQPPAGGTSPTGVLVELREGVDVLLDRLRRRLRAQERGKGVRESVAIIGRHAGYQIFAANHFDRLGADLEYVRDDLTDAKGAVMSREQVGGVLNKVFYIVKTILLGIDPARLRVS